MCVKQGSSKRHDVKRWRRRGGQRGSGTRGRHCTDASGAESSHQQQVQGSPAFCRSSTCPHLVLAPPGPHPPAHAQPRRPRSPQQSGPACACSGSRPALGLQPCPHAQALGALRPWEEPSARRQAMGPRRARRSAAAAPPCGEAPTRRRRLRPARPAPWMRGAHGSACIAIAGMPSHACSALRLAPCFSHVQRRGGGGGRHGFGHLAGDDAGGAPEPAPLPDSALTVVAQGQACAEAEPPAATRRWCASASRARSASRCAAAVAVAQLARPALVVVCGQWQWRLCHTWLSLPGVPCATNRPP